MYVAEDMVTLLNTFLLRYPCLWTSIQITRCRKV